MWGWLARPLVLNVSNLSVSRLNSHGLGSTVTRPAAAKRLLAASSSAGRAGGGALPRPPRSRYLLPVVVALSQQCLQGAMCVGTTNAVHRAALVDLYTSTNGTKWTTSTNWLLGDPCQDSWYGVACTLAPSGPNYIVTYVTFVLVSALGAWPRASAS
jgi:hypothetical protein